MNRFERAEVPPSAVSSAVLDGEVAKQEDYAAYTDLDTGVAEFPADKTIAALDKTLGSRITRFLLQTDAESTLHASALILEDHSKGEGKKDLQANLLINSVKEIVQQEAATASEHCRASEDLLRRCSLEPDFKAKVASVLIKDKAVTSSQIAIVTID